MTNEPGFGRPLHPISGTPGKHRVKEQPLKLGPVAANGLGKLRRVWKIAASRTSRVDGKPLNVMPEMQDELDPPFEALEPADCRGPLLFNSPHSGRIYPREFLLTSRLDLATLRRSEDSFVGELIEGVVARGHPVVRAHFPRCYVDVNREPYELDPRMFEGRLPSFANTRSMRVAGGLGTVARVVGDAQEIYDQRIAVAEAMRRIDGLYKPYHRALRRLFMRLQREFGAAILIDCHSMPSTTGGRDERPRADLVLGDRYGTSCVGIVPEIIEQCMRGFGYTVSRNKPYAGGFITEHYGNPTAGLHAIQLEINRGLYMDERRYERSASFAKLAGEFELLADQLAEIPIEELRPYRAAAE
jgi:N-formylglutamate amidohydrolase